MNHSVLSWSMAPAQPQLQNGEVHIWYADLNLPEALLKTLSTNLNSDEIARADRFIRGQDKAHFIAARGILRDILSRYSNIDAKNIVFNYNAKGKPSLKAKLKQPEIFFNLSHTHGVALYAVTLLNNVGIDIEYARRNIDAMEIAQRFFSHNEVEMLKSLTQSEQLSGFYKTWTRKEAYVKAIGEGLSHPLDQFTVDIAHNKSSILFHTHNQDQIMNGWYLYDIAISSDYIAALAMQKNDVVILRWQW